ATIDVDVGTAGHARERDGAGTDLTLQVGRDVLRLPGTYRRTRAERVVPGQFEPHVVPARRDAEVEWRDPHERAVDVDVGPAGGRLEGQGAPARLGCLGSYAVQGGIRHPAFLGDGVDDDREALREALLTDVAHGEQVRLVAKTGELAGVELSAAGDRDHLRQAPRRSDVEHVARTRRGQGYRLTGRDAVLRVEAVREDLGDLTARLDVEDVNVACLCRAYRDPDLLAYVVDRRGVAGRVPVEPDLNVEAWPWVDDYGLRADHDPLGGCQ